MTYELVREEYEDATLASHPKGEFSWTSSVIRLQAEHSSAAVGLVRLFHSSTSGAQ
jgi:hypothetical protein